MRIYFIAIIMVVAYISMQAQRSLSLQECEGLFQKNNLLLLAEQYNVTAASAQVIQARLWENPVASAELNLVNPSEGKVLQIGPNGQKSAAVEQLIYLGKKKKNEVAYAQSNTRLAELELEDLLRRLRHELYQSYMNSYFDDISIRSLDFQLLNLDSMISAYSAQVAKKNVPLRDLVRLQSLAMSLRDDRTQLANGILEQKSKLRLLTGLGSTDFTITPSGEELVAMSKISVLNADSLQSLALARRPDFRLASASLQSQDWYLKWQQSLAKPDLVLGTTYNQRGNAFPNEIGLTLSMPIPLWNKNQGNIALAEAQLKQGQLLLDYHQDAVRTEVQEAWQKYALARKNNDMLNQSFSKNLDEVLVGMYSNFQKQNISILEFTDFLESYVKSLLEFNQVRKALTLAQEELNFITNSTIF